MSELGFGGDIFRVVDGLASKTQRLMRLFMSPGDVTSGLALIGLSIVLISSVTDCEEK